MNWKVYVTWFGAVVFFVSLLLLLFVVIIALLAKRATLGYLLGDNFYHSTLIIVFNNACHRLKVI